MKHIRIVLLISLVGLIASCNTKKEEQVADLSDVVEECYQYIANNDTVTLSLYFDDNLVHGALFYNLYEKDKNDGVLLGELKGDTIIADYSFLSENIASVNEVVFLKRSNKLIQGFGETISRDGKQAFKSRSTLDFNGFLVLTAVECEKK